MIKNLCWDLDCYRMYRWYTAPTSPIRLGVGVDVNSECTALGGGITLTGQIRNDAMCWKLRLGTLVDFLTFKFTPPSTWLKSASEPNYNGRF